jgi:hypothetical protein
MVITKCLKKLNMSDLKIYHLWKKMKRIKIKRRKCLKMLKKVLSSYMKRKRRKMMRMKTLNKIKTLMKII